MRRVARDVSITPMALYRHYADREGLLNALADEGFVALASQLETIEIPGTLDKRLTRILDLYLDYAFAIRGSSNSCSSSPARAPAASPRTSRRAHLPPQIA